MPAQARFVDGEIEMMCANCQQFRHSEDEINYCEECGTAVCIADDNCHIKGCACMELARIVLPDETAQMWGLWAQEDYDEYEILRGNILHDVALRRAGGASGVPTTQSLRAASAMAA